MIDDSVSPFVCMYIRLKRFEEKLIFSVPILDKCLKIFVKIQLTNEHLFCYFCIRLSVGNISQPICMYSSLLNNISTLRIPSTELIN